MSVMCDSTGTDIGLVTASFGSGDCKFSMFQEMVSTSDFGGHYVIRELYTE
jgi:hypothetical protein